MISELNLIPVIDLLQGQVVRAVRGDRQAYRPIVSALCGSSDPVTVARILCDHCAARQLYVADLDALQGGATQVTVLAGLLEALPGIELWLDAGLADASAGQALRSRLAPFASRIVLVYGSESLRSREALERCFGAGDDDSQAALSLDRRDGQRLDAAGCWDAVALWPKRLIVMTLERVGSGAGPDLDTLRDVRRLAPGAMLIGAGGIRSEGDLARAAAAGADAWLVASALHDLQLPRIQR
ncbi:1-(5-phosphoribosyl)-5-[(5-phosphoribosylamino)methylideneamino] imidazole-4-carboxamide isomerase [Variovorax sp. PBL-H6]|uniref:HisA/HisF-related TIM barrel protein n=1 Tax=Variovorax sp. PBL-H6 TaxID=434009 RepID=UPI001319942F|nr:HisA/HisF-related TIM barrel protein [Variovorax sp. PBL-H6]VTU31310.1 1-(5-phosphoribosyl)-5-[(5-phosphoribosylamino)methylideneamino] imidazole-4-carboxamide isomerase [Variovorax sp. PBL-H6]